MTFFLCCFDASPAQGPNHIPLRRRPRFPPPPSLLFDAQRMAPPFSSFTACFHCPRTGQQLPLSDSAKVSFPRTKARVFLVTFLLIRCESLLRFSFLVHENNGRCRPRSLDYQLDVSAYLNRLTVFFSFPGSPPRDRIPFTFSMRGFGSSLLWFSMREYLSPHLLHGFMRKLRFTLHFDCP